MDDSEYPGRIRERPLSERACTFTSRFVLLLVAFAAVALGAASLPAAATAESNVMLTPAAGPAGTTVSLLGRSFGKRDRVTIRLGKSVVAKVTTSRRGSFRASFAIPARRPGRSRINSRSGGRRVVNWFGVTASPSRAPVAEVVSRRGKRMRWTPAAGPAGTPTRLRGSGFPARRKLRVRFGGVSSARREQVVSVGSRSASPFPMAAGRHLVRVTLRSRALGFLYTTTLASGVIRGRRPAARRRPALLPDPEATPSSTPPATSRAHRAMRKRARSAVR